jgi:hypothetical protein
VLGVKAVVRQIAWCAHGGMHGQPAIVGHPAATFSRNRSFGPHGNRSTPRPKVSL